MRKAFNTFFACLVISSAFGQSEQHIAYQQAHPDALIMTRSAFNALDLLVQELIQVKVVYLEDLQRSGELNEDVTLVPSGELNDSDGDFVKRWLADNATVKIVKRSEYEASSSELQMLYIEAHALVLIGENLTREDIVNY
ncbi:MAG: hypothetical protein A3D92_14180 [Bacteroidetes bacterium RIFCSPHIGHO2_02_FULL_44_7]|nr:MAG: hypothetical protein A3D92_14180 [Bacteroidetes bacterium RIFCSPHIGHO2_02_FULL_44_7]